MQTQGSTRVNYLNANVNADARNGNFFILLRLHFTLVNQETQTQKQGKKKPQVHSRPPSWKEDFNCACVSYFPCSAPGIYCYDYPAGVSPGVSAFVTKHVQCPLVFQSPLIPLPNPLVSPLESQ